MHVSMLQVVQLSCSFVIKSSLERVSNAVSGCIDGVYCELHHESAMNIILRFLAM